MITIFGIPFLRQEFIQNEEFSTYRNTVKNIMLDLNMAPYVKLIDRIYDDINLPTIEENTVFIHWTYWYFMQTFKDFGVITKKTSIINDNISSAKAGLSKAFNGVHLYYKNMVDIIYQHINLPFGLTIETIKDTPYFHNKANYINMNIYDVEKLYRIITTGNLWGNLSLRATSDSFNYNFCKNSVLNGSSMWVFNDDYYFAYYYFRNIHFLIHFFVILSMFENKHEAL